MTKLISLIQFYGVFVHIQQYHLPWWQFFFRSGMKTWTNIFQKRWNTVGWLCQLLPEEEVSVWLMLQATISCRHLNPMTDPLPFPSAPHSSRQTKQQRVFGALSISSFSSKHYLQRFGFTLTAQAIKGVDLHFPCEEWASETPTDFCTEWPMLL